MVGIRIPLRLGLNLPAAAGLLFILAAEPVKYSIPLVCAIILHEAGHFIALHICRGKASGIKMLPFGMSIGIIGDLLSYRGEIFICMMGPLMNIAAASVCVTLMRADIYSDSLLLFLICNVLLAALNLLPIKTLDGGRILLCIFLCFMMPDKAEKCILIVSMVFIVLMWAAAVYCWIRLESSLYMIMLSVYMFITVILMREKSAG